MKTSDPTNVKRVALKAVNIRMSRSIVGLTPVPGTIMCGYGTVVWNAATSQPSTVIWECAARSAGERVNAAAKAGLYAR